MAISLRSTTTATGGGSSSSISVTKPTGAAVDDVLVARISTAAPSATVTTPTGWTADATSGGVTASGSDHRLSTFWRRVDGSEGASFTFNFSASAFNQAQVYCYSGCVATGNPIESSSFNPSGASSGTTITATGLTITNATKLVFVGTTFNNTAPSTAPSGMTFRVRSDNQTMSDQDVTAGSTGARTLTISSDFWSGALIALLPAAGSPPAITATGAVSFGAPVLAGAGAEGFVGAGAASFGAPTLSGAAVEGFVGTGATAIGAPTLSGAAVETFSASGGPMIGAPTLSGAGAETFAGAGAVTIGGPALAGLGQNGQDVTAIGAVAVGAPALAGAGGQSFDAAGATSLAAPVLGGVGAVANPVSGAGAVLVGALALAGVGVVDATAGGASGGEPADYGPTRAVVGSSRRAAVVASSRRVARVTSQEG